MSVDYCPVKYLFDGGYLSIHDNGTQQDVHYTIKDCQGNVRVVAGPNGNIEQVNHFYPSGVTYAHGMSPGLQPYKFGDKELDLMHGLNQYDFGARFYEGKLKLIEFGYVW